MPLSTTDGAFSWQRLAVKNAHPRDERITFDEETHTYTIDGSREGWSSCTQFIHNFVQEFDADAIIKKMMGSKKWPESKYFGMTPEAIKAQWSNSANEASTAGTRMHLDIDRYNNAEPVGNLAGDEWVPNASTEWDFFLAYEEKWRKKNGFIPYRTEWLVFKEDIKLAGSIDMLYKKPDGTIAIYDWKRAKEIKFENRYQKGIGPLSHLDDCNYWHYSLQLNNYRRILEKFYGFTVSELALVILHPNNKSYKIIQLNLMDAEVDAMWDARLKAVQASVNGVPAPMFKTSHEEEEEESIENNTCIIED
jgi:hypothetical protein